ncbi:N-acetylmuramoyl-L-alanine amidase family protein [Halonatronum saccharophilum]|uniref:N-acetylmuramoyl-L-alanine amidase family protein n=1 Tax=Halonatronum saccharophilum TaxID=150060 RepID=UPI0004B4E577|nr:N-acetylmuramoyl-L-alanine amidase [Halonatronum saccharophilum]
MIILINKKAFISLLFFILFFIGGLYLPYSLRKESIPTSGRDEIIKEKKILIDAGHGGVDAGASHKGVLEKDINLDLARRMKKLLEEKGAKVIMTRDRDISLSKQNSDYKSRQKRDLKTRVDIINKNKPDLFISLHVNAFPGEFRINGPIVFYQDIRKENKYLAEKIQIRLNNLSFKDVDMPQNSIRLGDYYILNNSDYPGVLIEVGFINKKVDKELLLNYEYKNLLVFYIYQGILDYLNG